MDYVQINVFLVYSFKFNKYYFFHSEKEDFIRGTFLNQFSIVFDIKVSRGSQLNEYMNLYEYQTTMSFIDLGTRLFRFNIFKLLFLRNR